MTKTTAPAEPVALPELGGLRIHPDLAPMLAPIDNATPHPDNPRRGNVAAIAESMRVNGIYRPVMVQRSTGHILAGNHSWQALKQAGATKAPLLLLDVDDEKAKRILLADNRTADLGTYSAADIARLLESLDGDLEGTGYTDGDLNEILAGIHDVPVALTDRDDAPPKPKEAVTVEGDVWRLGPHRVLCGDSTDGDLVEEFLAGDRPDCVWTDPPYGVSYVGGTGLTIMNDAAADLPGLLFGAFSTIARVAKPGAPVYVAHADTERIAFEGCMLEAGLLVRQNLVWVKNSLVMGRADYHYKHEPILEGSNGEEPPEDPDEADSFDELSSGLGDEGPDHEPILYGFTGGGTGRLGRGGARWHGDNKQSTVLYCDKPSRADVHPTMKPVDLVLLMLDNSLRVGGLVLDLFGGSGSTLIAAHHHRSRSALVELDPKYVDVICRRWEEHTGVTPVLESTGAEHSFL